MSDDDAWRLPPTQHGHDIRLGRVAAKTPEAVVKVTGRSRGAAGHLLAQLDYITRNGTLPAETQDGERITDRARLMTLHDDWLLANAAAGRSRAGANAAQSVALTLSMPPGTPPDRVEAAARRWACDTFAGTHDWILARHDDTGHPHVHIAVRAVGTDGRRLAPGPADLQRWRERFAGELRRLGVEAEATPRVVRGRERGADPLPAHKADLRGIELRTAKAIQHATKADAGSPSPPPLADSNRDRQVRHDTIRRADLGHAERLDAGQALTPVLRNAQDGERRRRFPLPAPSGREHAPGLHGASPPAGPDRAEPTRSRPRGRG